MKNGDRCKERDIIIRENLGFHICRKYFSDMA